MGGEPSRASRGRTWATGVGVLVGLGFLCAFMSFPVLASAPADSTAGGRPGSIDGVVLDAGGRPVGGALVAAVPEVSGSSEEDTRAAAIALTARDGRFRLGSLPAGSYGVTATRSGLAAAFEGGRAVAPGRALRGVTLRMGTPAGVFRGLIRDTLGRPIPGAQVRAIRFSDFLGDVFYTNADSAGRYEIALPEAEYLLLFAAEGYAPEFRRHLAGGEKSVNAALAPPAPRGPAPDTVVDWIRGRAIPLRTVRPGFGSSDLEPLRATIGAARVVALGEATHGTREFFQLKHRMLEFLVSEMGFTVFGIEASMPEGFDVNEYVLTGRGDPAKALSGLYFWTWDTEEVLDLIRWMRRWNADPMHRRKVKFYGFDMQYSTRAVEEAIEYLRRVDPPEAAKYAEALAPIADAYREQRYGRLPADRRAVIASTVGLLERRFDERRKEYELRSSPGAWELARQHARVVGQWVELKGTDGFRARDRAMAENVLWILRHEGPDAKVVVWAHNGHVSAANPEVEFACNGMGFDLREALGSDLVVFGFAFNRGSFQAMEQGGGGLRSFTVAPTPAGSLDQTVGRTGIGVAAVDLRRLPASGPVADWFSARHLIRCPGATFSDSLADRFAVPIVAPRHFDALLFVDSTTAARANPHGARPSVASQAEPVNLDFEEGASGGNPQGWTGPSGLASEFYRAEVTGQGAKSGARCARIRRLPGRSYGDWFGSLSQRVPAAAYRGKHLRVRVAARVRQASAGSRAYLWLRAAGAGVGPAAERLYASNEDRPIVADEWREYTVEGDVPDDALTLAYGLAFVGEGAAWIDAVSVEVVEP